VLQASGKVRQFSSLGVISTDDRSVVLLLRVRETLSSTAGLRRVGKCRDYCTGWSMDASCCRLLLPSSGRLNY
jgi:hypothetical protein